MMELETIIKIIYQVDYNRVKLLVTTGRNNENTVYFVEWESLSTVAV